MKTPILLLVATLTLLSSCSKLMMSVKDRDKTNEDIVVRQEDSLVVHVPEFRQEIIGKLEETNWTEQHFCSKLRSELIEELKRRGIKAIADTSKQGNYLTVYISEYDAGSGFARAIELPFGIGRSELTGNAVLYTADGRRELIIQKQGHKSGMTAASDQTGENIRYFAVALAFKIASR